MQTLTRTALRDLARSSYAPCMTLTLPTHRATPESNQDPIRFRNLLKEARQIVESRSMSEGTELIDMVQELDTTEFWRHQLEGLTVLASPQSLSYYQLTTEVAERVSLGDAFDLRSLLSLEAMSCRYYVLLLTQNEVRLFRGDRRTLDPLEVPALPSSLQDALGVQTPIPHLGGHSSGPKGTDQVAFHGHKDDETHHETIQRFLRAVEAGVWSRIRGHGIPLIVAAVSDLHPLYRKVNRYPHLLERGVEGSFASAPPAELHERVWPLMRDVLADREREAFELYEDLKKTGRSSHLHTEIGLAAAQGRVELLLLREGCELPGTYDPTNGHLRDGAPTPPGSLDLSARLAHRVLRTGGEVLAIPSERWTSDYPLLALFRW